MGLFRKYVSCISPHSTLSHFVNFTLSLPLCYSPNFNKKLQNERKDDFLLIWLLQLTRITKEVENHIFRHIIEFLDTHVCISNPLWQSSGIIIFFCKYYIVISDTLGSLFLGCALFVAHCNINRASWETKKE